MNTVTIPVTILATTLFLTASVASEPTHVTPTAPADYLAKSNPFGSEDFDPAVTKKGGRLFKTKCRKCHGVEGDGQGPNAELLIIKPVAFAAQGYLAGRKDGQLYWIIENGSEGTDMIAHGPGSRINLNEEEIWKIVAYLRSAFTN